ncbi:MAG TPA: IS481 family transposase [Myxococcaceae bacterium]|nr:IS481 family transposase [Myxococcaceae bacterium]
MDERVKFIAAYLRGEMAVSRLCDAFGVSRKTAYKWIARYSEGGVGELVERSRRPHSHPNAMSPEVESLLIATRKQHGFWGPKKLVAVLRASYPGLRLPATSTIGHLLARRGLSHPRRTPRRSSPYGQPFLGYDKPNAVWCADFKGHFRLLDRSRCHPLTISDGFSRYLLKCEALRYTRFLFVKPLFEQTFREFGLPEAIRTDNGPPFSSLTLAGLSFLAVWWIRLGIRPERIKPGRPDQNGRHERMHRTLKHEAVGPDRYELAEQQKRFDLWRKEYNEVRPHEALGQLPPARLYEPSPRPFPVEVPEPNYPARFEIKRINHGGHLFLSHYKYYLSWSLQNELVGLEEVTDGNWTVYFGPHALAVVDTRAKQLRAIPGTVGTSSAIDAPRRKKSTSDGGAPTFQGVLANPKDVPKTPRPEAPR